MIIRTHAFFVVNLTDTTEGFGSSDDGDCLDRDPIAEARAFAIYDAWDIDICANAVLFAGFDDLVVGAHGLPGESSVTHFEE
jgi:hypothetical protein